MHVLQCAHVCACAHMSAHTYACTRTTFVHAACVPHACACMCVRVSTRRSPARAACSLAVPASSSTGGSETLHGGAGHEVTAVATHRPRVAQTQAPAPGAKALRPKPARHRAWGKDKLQEAGGVRLPVLLLGAGVRGSRPLRAPGPAVPARPLRLPGGPRPGAWATRPGAPRTRPSQVRVPELLET